MYIIYVHCFSTFYEEQLSIGDCGIVSYHLYTIVYHRILYCKYHPVTSAL